MKSNKQTEYPFLAEVLRETSGIRFHYIEFPLSAEKLFGKKGSIRVILTLNKVSFKRSLMPQSSGFHRLIIGGDIRKKTGISEGDTVSCSLRFDPEIPELIIPEELDAIFEMEPEINQQFNKLPPGMKRQICTWVAEGKKVETRVNRSLEIMKRFQNGKFHFGSKESNN
ncbi:MAG: YdeI/OmpD-associated family protein [Flavobacteriales bacterium]